MLCSGVNSIMRKKNGAGMRECSEIYYPGLCWRTVQLSVLVWLVCNLFYAVYILRFKTNKPCNCTNTLKLKWDLLKHRKQRRAPVTKLDVERTKLTMELKTDVKLWWKTIKAELLEFKKSSRKGKTHKIKRPKLREQYMALEIKIENVTNFDEEWQKQLSYKTAIKVKKIIDKLQNPKRCDEYGQLYVKVAECGFGCIMHDLTNKLNIATSYNKTLILQTSTSIYTRSQIMSDILEPISKKCQVPIKGKWVEPYKFADLTQNKLCIIKRQISGRAYTFRYPVFTDEMWGNVEAFHSDPMGWWISQMRKSLFKPKPKLQERIDYYAENVDFSSPIVGVHVRRSDKLTSPGEFAVFRPLSEFMKHVEEWYDKYDLRQAGLGDNLKVERRVYLASDDLAVWDEAKVFDKYTFLGNKEFTERASEIETRDTKSGLEDIIIEATLLSKCNFFVGTLSSEIGQLAIEMKQSTQLQDVFYDVRSLEYEYGLIEGPKKIQLVVYNSTKPLRLDEIELLCGDLMILDRNYFNGYYYGTNVMTGKKGFYKTHLVQNLPALLDMPNAALMEMLVQIYGRVNIPWLTEDIITLE
uniref:alpha-(1,6)-fucosyltransferase-like n=1 Tax=Ciona intestinalis TaxID=7719 RepID=UPI000EF536CD|nr:alpha-(1,6)-fucosyltransferase-like [Ciona intestinalis]|eukprot:XP_026689468.1 alpha-(1,6)-fucosyltransferase-like [Ciona intestinalis]